MGDHVYSIVYDEKGNVALGVKSIVRTKALVGNGRETRSSSFAYAQKGAGQHGLSGGAPLETLNVTDDDEKKKRIIDGALAELESEAGIEITRELSGGAPLETLNVTDDDEKKKRIIDGDLAELESEARIKITPKKVTNSDTFLEGNEQWGSRYAFAYIEVDSVDDFVKNTNESINTGKQNDDEISHFEAFQVNDAYDLLMTQKDLKPEEKSLWAAFAAYPISSPDSSFLPRSDQAIKDEIENPIERRLWLQNGFIAGDAPDVLKSKISESQRQEASEIDNQLEQRDKKRKENNKQFNKDLLTKYKLEYNEKYETIQKKIAEDYTRQGIEFRNENNLKDLNQLPGKGVFAVKNVIDTIKRRSESREADTDKPRSPIMQKSLDSSGEKNSATGKKGGKSGGKKGGKGSGKKGSKGQKIGKG